MNDVIKLNKSNEFYQFTSSTFSFFVYQTYQLLLSVFISFFIL